jgi:hypothetical protein
VWRCFDFRQGREIPSSEQSPEGLSGPSTFQWAPREGYIPGSVTGHLPAHKAEFKEAFTSSIRFHCMALVYGTQCSCTISVERSPSNVDTKINSEYTQYGPPLWSSGQSSWLQILRPGFESRHYQEKSSGSGTGSTQPREYN